MNRKEKTPKQATLAELNAGLDQTLSWPAKLAGEAGEEQRALMEQVLERQRQHEVLAYTHFGKLFQAYLDGLLAGGVSGDDARELALRLLPKMIVPDPQVRTMAALEQAVASLTNVVELLVVRPASPETSELATKMTVFLDHLAAERKEDS